MASFASSPLSAHLLAWMSLFLWLAPLWVRGESPTVKVNGTTIVGKSQASAGNVTIEFFGGECAGIFGTHHAFTWTQGFLSLNSLLENCDSRRPWGSTLSGCLFSTLPRSARPASSSV